jgi:protein-disulfide isomerase
VNKVEVNSEAGQKMIADLGVKAIPAFVFSKEITKTDFYSQAATYFENKNEQYILNTAQVGLPVGKYLQAPSVSADDVQLGAQDAKVKVVLFSDYQCPFCKTLNPTIGQVLKEFGDKILFVFKEFPLSIHPQAEGAALASMCASEQGKFQGYNDKLFATQADWGKAQGTQKFKTYAMGLGLNSKQFNECLDGKKFQSVLERNKAEAEELGLTGTPGTFVNGEFSNGAVPFEELKKLIEQELAK